MSEDAPYFRMEFGKFRGRLVEDVPADYLAWAVRQHGMRRNVVRACLAELKRRAAKSGVELVIDWETSPVTEGDDQ